MALFAQFTETRKVVPNGPTFMKDKVYKMDRASIEHWVHRGVAFECGDPGAVKKKPGRPKKDTKPQPKSTAAEVSKPVEDPEPEATEVVATGDVVETVSTDSNAGPLLASKDDWPGRP